MLVGFSAGPEAGVRRSKSRAGKTCVWGRPGGARGDRSQAMQRVALDLAASLRSDPERCADLFVTLGAPVVQDVTAHEHLAVALGQQPQHRRDLEAVLARDHALRGVDGSLV